MKIRTMYLAMFGLWSSICILSGCINSHQADAQKETVDKIEASTFAGQLTRADKLFHFMKIGKEFEKEGRYNEAIAVYFEAMKYVALETDISMIHRQLAPLYETLGDLEHALNSYEIVYQKTQSPLVRERISIKLKALRTAMNTGH